MASTDMSSVDPTASNGSNSEQGSSLTWRIAQNSAQILLNACACSACRQPLRDPITLPCGHSSCLQCIRVLITQHNDESAAESSAPRRPPRYPLAATTIPCPHPGCPRRAIGKGLGAWKGYHAHYGADENVDLPSDSTRPDSSEDEFSAAAAASSLDGFVAPLNHSLTVVPPQSSSTFATHYGISKYDVQGKSVNNESSLLKTDVTLTKLIEVLVRYAGSLDRKVAPASSSERWLQHRQSHTPSMRSRRRSGRGLQSAMRASGRDRQYIPDDTRTEIHPRFLGILGASEEGIDQCTVGGVSAVQAGYSDEDSDEDAQGDFIQRRHIADEDFEEDDIGGAFARGSFLRRSSEDDSLVTASNLPLKTVMTVAPGSDGDEDVLYDNDFDDDATPVSPVPTTTQMKVQHTDGHSELASLQSELIDVLECQLCYMLLNAPLTTPCGHTYCRRCFARSLDHSTSCPLCRAEMPPFAFFQEHPVNHAIMKVLQGPSETDKSGDDKPSLSPAASEDAWLLKKLYDDRQAAIEEEERASLLSTPIFVCTLGFPFMPTILHVFEPRYRLMIRRCLESGHPRFGMVMHSQDVNSPVPGMSPYGTMLEIKTVQMLPDGRSMIETAGTTRFRVLEKGSLDGYTVGRIEPVEDVPPEQETELELASIGFLGRWDEHASDNGEDPASLAACVGGSLASAGATQVSRARPLLTVAEAREAHVVFQAALGLDALAAQQGVPNTSLTVSPVLLRRTTTEHVQACLGFLDTLRSGSAPWLMTRLNDTYGPMPPATDVAAFGYWMALVMPIDEQEKAKLLPIRSARLRLLVVVHWIEQLRQTWWFNHGCSVQ